MNVLEKIYIYAFPDWISIYEVSKKIYGRDESYVNEVVEKNKKYFECNSKNQIRSKPKLLMNSICNLTDFTPDERATLKRLIDDKNFRLVIGFLITESKFFSIQQIESVIKHFALILTEFRKIAKNPEISDDVEKALEFIESNPIMIEKQQIIKKEVSSRTPDSKNIAKNDLRAIFGIVINLDKLCSKHLIEKLSTLPVPLIIELATSMATASFIKCKI